MNIEKAIQENTAAIVALTEALNGKAANTLTVVEEPAKAKVKKKAKVEEPKVEEPKAKEPTSDTSATHAAIREVMKEKLTSAAPTKRGELKVAFQKELSDRGAKGLGELTDQNDIDSLYEAVTAL